MKFPPPLGVFAIYIALILFYAVLYYFFPESVDFPEHFQPEEWNYGISVYYSVVTITTLGYGDFTPSSGIGKTLAASEAIFGIVIIGVFLSSLWHKYSQQIQDAQADSAKEQIRIQNLQKLTSYRLYLNTVIVDFQLVVAELTTPMSDRKNVKYPDPEFKFSDLQDLYKPSLLFRSGLTKPLIRSYYEMIDSLTDELKYVLANFDLSDYPDLQRDINEFLARSRAEDVRELFFSIEKIKAAGTSLKDTMMELIKENEACPDLDTNTSNLLTPVIYLFGTLKFQIRQIRLISETISRIVITKVA